MRALTLALLLPLAACGSDDTTVVTTDADAPAALTPDPAPEAADEPASGDAAGDAAPAAGDAPVVTGPNEAQLDADAEADAEAQMEEDTTEDITELRDLVVGDWTLAVGPAESATFTAGETRGAGEVSFYANDRLMDSGTWSVSGDVLTVRAGSISGSYTLAEAGPESLAFTGGMGAVGDEATMLLQR